MEGRTYKEDQVDIDEAGSESFPASDPPGWTSGISRNDSPNEKERTMKIREAMSTDVEFVHPDTSVFDVAKIMAKRNCGFLPVSNSEGSKLEGVITDRDLVIRAVAKGLDPNKCTAKQAMSEKVLYCYADDELASATKSMSEQKVYRLIVLSDPKDKKLCGIISLGDIVRHDHEALAQSVAKSISEKAA